MPATPTTGAPFKTAEMTELPAARPAMKVASDQRLYDYGTGGDVDEVRFYSVFFKGSISFAIQSPCIIGPMAEYERDFSGFGCRSGRAQRYDDQRGKHPIS